MANGRGIVASYPFSVQVPETYQPRNEERYRAQVAQQNADIFDRLANLETDVDNLQDAPPPVIPTVPDFATEAEAIDGNAPDKIISPLTLDAVLATLTNLLVPTGAVMHFAGAAPAGWLLCDGAVVTATHADLRAYLLAAGSPYGVTGADPKLPDLRGEFIRGADLGRGVDTGRVFGSAQTDAFKSHQHSIQGQVIDGAIPGGTTNPSVVAGNRLTATLAAATGGTETRPRNIALRACIKT